MNTVLTGYLVLVDRWKFPIADQPTDSRLVVFVGPPDGRVFADGNAFPGSLDGPPAKADAEKAHEAIRSELTQVWGAKLEAVLSQAQLRSAERQTDVMPIWTGMMT